MDEINTGYSSVEDQDVQTGSKQLPPPDDYKFATSSAELKKTASGGYGIQFVDTILDGPFAGFEIKDFVNIQNKSKTAEDIGKANLKTRFTVTGKKDAQSHNDLIGVPYQARCIHKPDSFTNDKGEHVEFVKLTQKILMTLDGKNAKGDAMEPFDIDRDQPKFDKPKTTAQKVESQTEASSGDTGGEEIPF